MRSSLTLLCETLSHFPVLGGGVGLYPSRNCSGGNMMFSYSLTICLILLHGKLSHFPVLGFGIGLYPSRNCSGGNMMFSYSLTICLILLSGTGLGFTLSHFPVLGGGIGFFRWFINNLINCPLISFLRSFFSISIL